MKNNFFGFSRKDFALWGFSISFIVLSFVIFDRTNYFTLVASILGATSLIFNAKGNPIGQVLMVIFSIFYGVVSFGFKYYGEMITYLGMTAPMAIISLISWLTHPFKGKKIEVEINKLGKKEVAFSFVLTGVITLVFYFILKMLNTTNLLISALSVATSFIAAYLTFRRSPYFALAYAANDVVLIVMWIMATATDISYLSVIICFVIFLINDLYGFISWLKRRRVQSGKNWI